MRIGGKFFRLNVRGTHYSKMMFGTGPSWLMAEWTLSYCTDVLQLQQQQNRLMKINHDLRHRITVVEAQGKALIEQKVELEAYLQTKEQEMSNLRAELGKLREKLQGEDSQASQNGEEVKVRGTLTYLLNSLLKSFGLHTKYLFAFWQGCDSVLASFCLYTPTPSPKGKQTQFLEESRFSKDEQPTVASALPDLQTFQARWVTEVHRGDGGR